MIKKDGTLLIKKRIVAEWLALYIFAMPFLLTFLMEVLYIPSIIKYTVDVAWVCVSLIVLIRRKIIVERKIFPVVIFTGLFLLYVAVAYLFHFQSAFYFLWGFRNNFRLFFAFIAFALFINEDTAVTCLNFVDVLFWINAIVAFFQFFVLGYKQDYLGGIFGVYKGCNAYLLIFFVLVVGKALPAFMNGEESALRCFLKCGVSVVIATMAELKVYFILFVIILVISVIFTKFSFRKFAVILLAAVLLMFASSLFTEIFGADKELSLDVLMEAAFTENYATAEDYGRFTAIPSISETFFDGVADNLFGMGLGNCDTSTFEVCNTPFYQMHSNLHYNWFMSAFLFIETGIVGLILCIIFYIIIFVIAVKLWRNGTSNRLFCQIAVIMSLMCIVFTFYNAALRTEVGYIAFFAMALPFTAIKSSVTDVHAE